MAQRPLASVGAMRAPRDAYLGKLRTPSSPYDAFLTTPRLGQSRGVFRLQMGDGGEILEKTRKYKHHSLDIVSRDCLEKRVDRDESCDLNSLS